MNKRIKTGVNVFVSVIICFAILCMINFLSARHYQRFDLSSSKMYSLSDKTIKVLNSLDDKVNVYVLFQPISPMYDRIKRLLEEYSGKNKKILVQYVDPARDLAQVKVLVDKYKVEHEDIIIFDYKGKMKFVGNQEIAEYDYSGIYQGKAPQFKAFKGEQAFTSALLEIIKGQNKTVFFTTGHGEKTIKDKSEKGISNVVNLLHEDNLKIEELVLLDKEKIPANVNLIVIAGPTKAFLANEIKILKEYILEKKGKVFFLLDPIVDTGLEKMLLDFGVNVGDNVVVDPFRKLPFVSAANLFITEYTPHEITSGMKNMATIYPLARSVGRLEDKSPSGFVVIELGKTSDKGWGEVDYSESPFEYKEGKDLKGPVPISAIAYDPKDKESGKIAVVGNSNFVINTQVGNLGNADFFLNTVNWLVEQEELISISPKSPERMSMILSSVQMQTVFWIFVIGMPLIWIIIGIVVYLRRR